MRCRFLVLLAVLLAAWHTAGAEAAGRRKLQGGQVNNVADPVAHCFMVEVATPEPTHTSLKRSHRRLLTAASAKHTDAVVEKAKEALGDEAVAAHHALGPIFPGFSIHASDEAAASRLMDFMEAADEVVAYRRCVQIPAIQPASIGPIVGPPPMASIVDGVYESEDGAEVRRMPGYENLYGQGITVAVIDSGIDYRHPGLGGCFGPRCKVIGGYDFVGNFGTAPSTDVRGCAGFDHGTLVSGVIAANYTFNYTLPGGGLNTVRFMGVAPGVKLLAYRVFPCGSGGTTDALVAVAVQKAYAAGADIINLSLGASGSWESAAGTLQARLTRLGVVVVQAQGNDANQGLFIGSQVPASPADQSIPVISVGSTDDVRITGPAVITLSNGVTQTTIGTRGEFPSWNIPPLDQLRGLPLRVTTNMLEGINSTNDACTGTRIGDFRNSIALVRRGTCTFAEKIQNVVRAGARAVIILNYEPAPLWPIIAGDNVSVPYLTISGGEGDLLAQTIISAQRDNANLFQVTAFRYISAGVSAFSNWGPSPDLRLTPDFVAPGGNVYTLAFWSDLTQRAPTSMISGTSFSAPYIAGCAALYLQAARAMGLRPTPTQLRDAFAATARPIQRVNTSTGDIENVWESPLRAGAGRINLAGAIRALSASVTLSPATLLLPTGRTEITTRFNITNASPDATVRYVLGHIPTEAISTDDSMNITFDTTVTPPQYRGALYTPTINPRGLQLTFRSGNGVTTGVGFLSTVAATTVTVAPRSTVTVEVKFSVPQALQQGNFILSGYITATAQPDAGEATPSRANLTLPYLGYSSNFSNLPILKPDIPGGIALPAGSVFPTSSFMVLVDGDGALIPPYNELFANRTRNGTRPLLPAYANINYAANMPSIYINVQHQMQSTNFTLVEADNVTGVMLSGGREYWVGDFSPERNSQRSDDPIAVAVPVAYYDYEAGYFLPIPDGTYVAKFVFARTNAAADVALGINPVVTEEWISPAFVLLTPQGPPVGTASG